MAYFDMSKKGDAQKLGAFFSPSQVDNQIRQAIQFCWMMLPQKQRTMEGVESQIRRMVERALRDFREDWKAFNKAGPRQ